jgi:hypothetical protein
LKILIIGLGSIAKKHIKAIFLIDPHSKIYALRVASDNNIEGVQNIYNLEILQEKIDFVLISNPTILSFTKETKLIV